MPYRTIVAAFFFREGGTEPSLEHLLDEAGVTGVSPLSADGRLTLGLEPADPTAFQGTWGVFGRVWAIFDTVDATGCLQLYAKFDALIDAQLKDEVEPGAHDGVTGYARQFGAVCTRLDPALAFVDAHSHYDDQAWVDKEGNRRWVLGHCDLVADGDVNTLADRRLSILFVPSRLLFSWIDDGRREVRETIDLPSGRLFFAGSGPSRMV